MRELGVAIWSEMKELGHETLGLQEEHQSEMLMDHRDAEPRESEQESRPRIGYVWISGRLSFVVFTQ